MMAVRAPLTFSPSTNPLISAFSPFSEHPDSPRPRAGALAGLPMNSTDKGQTASVNQLKPPPANSITSPQDPVAPSPVASDVTNFEDVDEDVEEEDAERGSAAGAPPNINVNFRPEVASPLRAGLSNLTTPLRLDTVAVWEQQIRARLEEETEPQSVIHVPADFGKFPQLSSHSTTDSEQAKSTPTQQKPEEKSSADQQETEERSRAGSANSLASESTITKSSEADAKPASKTHEVHMPPTPLQTSLPPLPIHDWSRTPRAQTRQDFGSLSRPGSSLASILEGDDTDHPSTDGSDEDQLGKRFLRDAEAEINALRTALSECWTLCNTLASLSHIHRERIFNFSGGGDMQEQAWKSCWRLCQNLYNTRDDNQSCTHNSSRPTLDLCRDFCQALFEVRVRDNEAADSVLRVSFELNNHLFNTHDRSLPEAFRERTLDFYITLCHRLMKQKGKMADETDSLLRACWSLAEMLFSLRQSRREGKKPDQELLGSAIQACWELCDLFREGWTQIRPERGTPRPSQTTFTQAYNQARRSGFAPLDNNGNPKLLPETPTTIFEDTVTTISPDEAPTPNILVLGAEEASRLSTSSASSTPAPGHRQVSPNPPTQSRNPHSANPVSSAANNNRWSSASSVFSLPASAVSEGGVNPMSATTVSTVRTPAEDPTLVLLKALFVRAALSTGRGYSRTSADPNLNSLPNFAKNLADNAFGNQAWQVSLMENYRKAIANDPSFRNLGIASTLGERGRLNAVEVARAVRGMTSCVYGFGWLRDLYRLVFGYYVEEALRGSDAAHSGPGRRIARPGITASSLVAAVMGNTSAASATTPGGATGTGPPSTSSGNGSGKGNGRRTVSQ